MTDSAQSTVTDIRKKRETGSDIEQFYGYSLDAYQVFSSLGVLTENLRVLSFNAEFASGRAGAKGNCVRVLTQATRELVNQLSGLFEQIEGLESQNYAAATRGLLIRGHAERMESKQAEADNERLNAAIEEARKDEEGGKLSEDGLAALVNELVRCNEDLAMNSARISAIAQECDAIAVAIAVEAAVAGEFQQEFDQVASTMHRYVDELQKMVGSAGRAIRRAKDAGARMTAEVSGQAA